MNGDFTLEARSQWESAAKVISPLMIFAVLDAIFARNFANTMAPPGKGDEHFLVLLKEHSGLKKRR